MVIFGASGDLTQRKLIPALFNLYRKKRLPEVLQIVGFSNLEWDAETFRHNLRGALDKFADYPFTDPEWLAFSTHLTYLSADFTHSEDYAKLKAHLKKVESGPTGRIYYLATPPAFFPKIALHLGEADMLKEDQAWRRTVIEKPFGSSLQSAQLLNKTLHQVMSEDQIFRIDHYLGKETVQNLLVFRFANTIFEPVWGNKYIDHVKISVAEEVGVGHRAGYYDKAGVLRDMFQNHLLQLLMLIAIEPPGTLKHKDLHARKVAVLKALRPITGEDVATSTVRGQYIGYREEEGVAPDSETATYGALRMFIDNPRWKGVPFYLRSGKALPAKCSEIIIQFICPTTAVFPLPPSEQITPNILAIYIQPNEGIFLRFEAKVPDTESDMRSVEMEFHYDTSFGPSSIPEAYERLILEVMQGDHTLFTQDDTAELAWRWLDPILAEWEGQHNPALVFYEPGTWGPDEGDKLIENDGGAWQITCGQPGLPVTSKNIGGGKG